MLVLLALLALTLPQERTEAPDAEPLPRWQALAARCGEQVHWASDWSSAAERARAEHKPVLAVAWMFAMFQLGNGARSGLAMEPEAIALLNTRFVPFEMGPRTEAPFRAMTSYGMPDTALGAALLVVSPEGQVLADFAQLQVRPACAFLRGFLSAHPEFPAPPEPADASLEERALSRIECGELELAAQLLQAPASPRAHLLQARLRRYSGDGEGALVALERARRGATPELEDEIDLEELRTRGERPPDEALRALAERRAAADSEGGRAARFTLAYLDLVTQRSDTARAQLQALADEDPDSPWAWQAAVLLLAAPAEIELGVTLAPPQDDVLALPQPVPFESATADEARRDAVRWLLARQRADGGWPDVSELAENSRYRNDLSMAADALAGRALLALGERTAADGAAAALLRARRERELWKGPNPMSYAAWSLSAWLSLVSDALEARLGEPGTLRALGAELAAELVALQRKNGGWSYFYSTSLAEDAPTLEQSISFITASVVLALVEAHEAGIEIDEGALESAVDCLEAMRDPEGVFAYMLWTFEKAAGPQAKHVEAAGRGPACELALLRAGRGDLARVRRALERYVENLPALVKERGKALMHCGSEAQGCHYVLWDFALAARAVEALPPAERAAFRARLEPQLLGCRRADGSFLDAPVIGTTAGTAMALDALTRFARED